MTVHPLLALIESGRPVPFDNGRAPSVLPPVHPFQLGCLCPHCEATWTRNLGEAVQ